MTFASAPVKPIELIGLCVSVTALAASIMSAFYVYVQVKAYLKQQEMEFHLRLNEINRELLKMGFDYPDLLALLNGTEIIDKNRQTRFIQMWINQSLVMWLAKEHGIISEEAWYSLQKDISTFVNRPPMKEHWKSVAGYYIPPFANFVNGLIKRQDIDG